MKTTMALSVLFISAASATPSLANYFHNPHLNLNRNIGSAPSPTPRDIRDNRVPHAHRTVPATTGAGTTEANAEPNAQREASNK
jgi:hypothetical protein